VLETCCLLAPAKTLADMFSCAMQPMQSTAQLSVYDPALTLVPQLGETITATVPLNQSSQPGSSSTAAAPGSAGRRRQRRLLHSQAGSQVSNADFTCHDSPLCTHVKGKLADTGPA